MKERLVGAALAVLGVSGSAVAADMVVPVYKAQPAAVSDGGYYLWVDGTYDRVKLPTYSLGFHGLNAISDVDSTNLQSFDPRSDGGGVRGALGYKVPGSSLRLEFGLAAPHLKRQRSRLSSWRRYS
jgi:hypothetical protein